MRTACSVVLTTIPADHDAEALARALVTEGLAACVNVLPPMLSVFRWKGALESASERQLLVKTADHRVDALRERLLALHPYEVPEFLVVPVAGGSEGYLSWIEAETGR